MWLLAAISQMSSTRPEMATGTLQAESCANRGHSQLKSDQQRREHDLEAEYGGRGLQGALRAPGDSQQHARTRRR